MFQCTEIHRCIPLHNQTPKKKKSHGHFIRSWKGIWQNSASFQHKSLGKIRNSRLILKHSKSNILQLVANIKLNREKLDATPLNSGNRHGCLFSPYLFKIILEDLDRAIRQHKDVKGIQTRKEEVKLSLFANMIVYLRNPKSPPEKTYSW